MQTLVLAHPKFDRLIALFEVLAILLLTILMGITLFDMGRHPLTSNLLHHLAFMLVPVLWLLLRGQALQVYGISLRNRRADWNAAMTAYLPLALGAAPLGFLDYRSWAGALVLSAVQIGVLFWVARRLSGKPDVRGGYWMLLISSLVLGGYSFWRGLFPGVGVALLAVFTYMSVGFGEEMLYRGFMQTRLDQAFGRPYRFYGVSWGWGLILTSLIFGLTHTGILRLIFLPIVQGEMTLSWPWGMWTFFGGLVFGWVRGKTGSIVAPALLHGLPQAVAVALLGL